jgi:hypothetical protein
LESNNKKRNIRMSSLIGNKTPPSYSICNRPSHQRSAFLQKKKENSRMSDLHKWKELWSIWWKRNQNNKINPKLTYKKRRLWSNKTETTYKKKRIEPNLKKKKKENLNWPKKRKILNHPTKRKGLPNWSTKKKKENWIFSQKKTCWPMK